MISYDNVKIMVIDTREGEYNYKKKKYIKFKTPKITKIANKIYWIFKSNYIFFLENGYVKF